MKSKRCDECVYWFGARYRFSGICSYELKWWQPALLFGDSVKWYATCDCFSYVKEGSRKDIRGYRED